MNFTQIIKQEIIEKIKKPNERLEFVKGFIFANSKKNNNNQYILSVRDNFMHNKVIECLDKLQINYELSKNSILLDISLIDISDIFKSPSHFFAGVFCGGGSISDLKLSSYHLQLSSNDPDFMNRIIEKLNMYDFNFASLKYRNKYLIYIKKQEKISDFLKAILALNSCLIFEENTINRDYFNSRNRLTNIDTSNIKRSVEANLKHIKNIEYIKKHNLEDNFTDQQLVFFAKLIENPNENLTNFADILASNNISITKSGLNHWLIKLKKFVNEHKNR